MLDGIRCVLFDAVGTLVYPDPPVAAVYHAAAQRFGSRLSVDEIGPRFRAALAASQCDGSPTSEDNERQRWRQIVKQVIDDVHAHQNAHFEQLWQHIAKPEHWRLYQDVANCFDTLRSRGYRLGIASNFDSRLHSIVSGHPILTACDDVFVSSEVGYTKPHPEFFHIIQAQLRLPASEIALIGDDPIADIHGAINAGWRAIQLDRAAKLAAPTAISTLLELAKTPLGK